MTEDDTDMKNFLNIAEIKPVTENLGPGKRFALWVQGCPFNCKNCISPNWIPFERAQVTSIQELATQILTTPKIVGITISGGEPMMQAGRLHQLLSIVKKVRPELDVIVFSGFELPQLVWEEAKDFLAHIDVLIAGVYIDKLNDNQGLRGSSNQSVHFITDKFKGQESYFFGRKRDVEFHLEKDGILMIGIPDKDFKW
jgi:anaerobic ribonucleoside-triphosphate reductase activating protein